MEKWHDIAKSLAWSVLFVSGIFLCLLLFQTSTFEYNAGKDLHSLTLSAQDTFTAINQDCGTVANIHPCGTLADIARTLNTIRGTFGQVEIAAIHENKNLTTLDNQEAQLFAVTLQTLTDARNTASALTQTAQAATKTIQTTNTTVADLQPVLGHLSDLIVSGKQTTDQFNVMLANPIWVDTAKNLNKGIATGDQMLDTLNQVETKATKSYLHPPKSLPARFFQDLRPFLVPTVQIGGAVAAATIH